MRLLQIVGIGCLSAMVIGNKTSSFLHEFLSITDDKGDWNEESATNYLNRLVEKHGSEIREEIDKVSQDEKIAYESLYNKAKEDSARRWHVGDVTLTKLDKNVIGSMFGKLRGSLSSWISPDDIGLQDYGVYLFSFSDTDIFEGLGEK